MLRKHNSLEEFFPDNGRSLEIVLRANSISGGFAFWNTTKGCKWSFYCLWVMFDPVDEMLPVVTVAPAERWARKKMRPIFSVSTRTYRCLQTLIFISAREEQTRSFLSILRITLRAWALPNLREKQSTVGTVSFTALWRGEDPVRAVLWHKYREGNPEPRGPAAWPRPSCFLLQNNEPKRKTSPIRLELAHRCSQLRRGEEGKAEHWVMRLLR